MTALQTLNMNPFFDTGTESKIVQSFQPCIRHHWLVFTASFFSLLLAFTAFGVNTITGLCILSISSFLIGYSILSVYTTKCVITHRGILMKKGPFSRKFKEMAYGDIHNILVKQGMMQKRLKIGNLAINTGQGSRAFKGIKNPHRIKELINREKSSEYERRTLLRKIL